MPRRILSVSHAKPLLDTRAMLLEHHGYLVTSVDDPQDAPKLCRSQQFDAAIIGHSIPIAEQQRIAAAARETNPGVFVVALTNHVPSDAPFADAAVDAFRPDELVRELDRSLGGRKSGVATE